MARKAPVFLCGVPVILLTLLGGLAQDSPSYRMIETPDFRVFEDGATPRSRVRVNFYQGSDENPWDRSPGQVSIEHGLPVWKPEYKDLFAKFPLGKRWRLGSNYWTNLSSSFSLESAGGKIAAGYYYLVLERSDVSRWDLVLIEPAEVRRRQLDPWHIGRKESGRGTVLPLQLELSTDVVEQLQITLKVEDKTPRSMVIHIRFGPYHFWSSPLTVQF